MNKTKEIILYLKSLEFPHMKLDDIVNAIVGLSLFSFIASF